MADQKPSAPGSTAEHPLTDKHFVDMSGSEKFAWLGKVFIMLWTGGFVFPNIFIE